MICIIIIDDEAAYGGSYNFTINARSNFENFKLYAKDEVQSLLHNFKDWMSRSIDFFNDLISPEKIVEEMKRKFSDDEKRKTRLAEEILHGFKHEEDSINNYKQQIIESEVKKEELRALTTSLSTGVVGINHSGIVKKSTENSIQVKPHKFYGGSFLSSFDGKKRPNSYAIAFLQKKNIETKYNFIKCRIINDSLICKGIIKSDFSQTYTFKLEYRSGEFPQVYILSPTIDKSPDVHVFKEGSLCLFYPPDIKWKNTTSIADYTIPWVVEWIYLYELWKLTGKWEAPEEKHL